MTVTEEEPRGEPRFSEDLRRALKATERVGFLEKGHPDLLSCMDGFMDSFASTGQKTHVLFLEGLPGAGKTHFRDELILPYIRQWIKRIPAATQRHWLQPETESDIFILHWDNAEHELDGLISQARGAREKGKNYPEDFTDLIQTVFMSRPPRLKTRGLMVTDEEYQKVFDEEVEQLLTLRITRGEMYPLAFLWATDILLRKKLMDELHKEKHHGLIIVEKPGSTYLPVDTPTLPKDKYPQDLRDYGASMIQDLSLGVGVFDRIQRKNLRLGYIGLIPGPSLDLFITARHLIQQAKSEPDQELALTRANEIALIFGLPPFKSYAKLQAFPGGASLKQFREVRRVAIELLEFVQKYERHRINLPENLRALIKSPHKLPSLADPILAEIVVEAREVANLLGEDSTLKIRESAKVLGSSRILERIAGLCADDLVIAYNNPPVKIPDEKALKKLISEIPV